MKTLKERARSLQSKYSTLFRNVRRRIQVRMVRYWWGRTPTIAIIFMPEKSDDEGRKVANKLLSRALRKGCAITIIPIRKV